MSYALKFGLKALILLAACGSACGSHSDRSSVEFVHRFDDRETMFVTDWGDEIHNILGIWPDREDVVLVNRLVRSGRPVVRQTRLLAGRQIVPQVLEVLVGSKDTTPILASLRMGSLSVLLAGDGPFGSDCVAEYSSTTGDGSRYCALSASRVAPTTLLKLDDRLCYCGMQVNPPWLFGDLHPVELLQLSPTWGVEQLDFVARPPARGREEFAPACGDIVRSGDVIYWSVPWEVRRAALNRSIAGGVFATDLPFSPVGQKPSSRVAAPRADLLLVLTYSRSFRSGATPKSFLYAIDPSSSGSASQSEPKWETDDYATRLLVDENQAYLVFKDKVIVIDTYSWASKEIRFPSGRFWGAAEVIGDHLYYLTEGSGDEPSRVSLWRIPVRGPHMR